MTTTTTGRDIRVLEVIAAAGDAGITPGRIYQETIDLWDTRSEMFRYLAGLRGRRLVYQAVARGPYRLPIAAVSR